MGAHPDEPIALMGDFIVAPFDIDNGDPTVIPGLSTHVSEPERAAFHALEAHRPDRRGASARARGTVHLLGLQAAALSPNEGMRIDFVLGSHAFADKVVAAQIHRNERKGDGPSDHVPVTVDLDIRRGG